MTPSGEHIQVPPGQYIVEVAETWLQLMPAGGERFETILVEAQQETHKHSLATDHAEWLPAFKGLGKFSSSYVKNPYTGLVQKNQRKVMKIMPRNNHQPTNR